jgi:pimeloyl-ACP methyl ester carboxylesterase
LAILHGLDRAIAQQGGWNYAISKSKLSLTREEALTMRYTWRTWRYQQANETGIFEVSASPGGIFNRTAAAFIAEARFLFGENQPRSLQAEAWSPRNSLAKLTIPLIYVAGEFDPWEGLGIERDCPLQNGRYFYVPDGLHCPDVYDRVLGHEVISALLQFAQLSNHPRG